jgi:hypothetical protein
MLGVRFLLSEDKLQFAGTQVGPILAGPENSEVKTKHFYIYERPHPLPRAWVVHSIQSVGDGIDSDTDDTSIVEVLVSPEFQPDQVAIVDAKTAETLSAKLGNSNVPDSNRKVTFPVSHQTNNLSIEVAAGEPGYLVVNDTYMTGWTATVNGQAAQILRANLFQRMVILPAEAARVEFEYVTPGFYKGLITSAISLLLLVILALWYVRDRITRRREQRLLSPDPATPTESQHL